MQPYESFSPQRRTFQDFYSPKHISNLSLFSILNICYSLAS